MRLWVSCYPANGGRPMKRPSSTPAYGHNGKCESASAHAACLLHNLAKLHGPERVKRRSATNTSCTAGQPRLPHNRCPRATRYKTSTTGGSPTAGQNFGESEFRPAMYAQGSAHLRGCARRRGRAWRSRPPTSKSRDSTFSPNLSVVVHTLCVSMLEQLSDSHAFGPAALADSTYALGAFPRLSLCGNGVSLSCAAGGLKHWSNFWLKTILAASTGRAGYGAQTEGYTEWRMGLRIGVSVGNGPRNRPETASCSQFVPLLLGHRYRPSFCLGLPPCLYLTRTDTRSPAPSNIIPYGFARTTSRAPRGIPIANMFCRLLSLSATRPAQRGATLSPRPSMPCICLRGGSCALHPAALNLIVLFGVCP